MHWPKHYECATCPERITILESQAASVAGEATAPERRARLTAERLHGWTDPPGEEDLVCPDCLTSEGVQTELALA